MHDDDLVPAEERIYGWIEHVFAQGVRRPGYPADRWAEQFCLERFHDFGLEDVRLEPVELPYWEPRSWSLTVWADGPGAVQFLEVPCFPLPHAAASTGVEASLVAFDQQPAQSVRGAIALYEVPLMRSRHATLAGLATWCYDPGGTFAEWGHFDDGPRV